MWTDVRGESKSITYRIQDWKLSQQSLLYHEKSYKKSRLAEDSC